jgi:hypothetical protein
MIIEHAVQQLERELSDWRSLDEVKRYLRRAGFTQKAILSDAEMERVGNLVRQDPRALETPDAELRYIEGLFGVPLGSIPSFLVIPRSGHEQCSCGRTPSALDVVYYAVARQIHSRELMRDTMLGVTNVMEMSDDGRTTQCYSCGRAITFDTYYKKAYVYV